MIPDLMANKQGERGGGEAGRELKGGQSWIDTRTPSTYGQRPTIITCKLGLYSQVLYQVT